MANTQDLFSLQYSKSFAIQGLQEEAVNLTLTPSGGTMATVFGTVTDGTKPVSDAVVKLFDNLGQPYQHTMTNTAGEYTMDGIPAGTYSLAAAKSGYFMSDALGVSLSAGDTAEILLTLAVDATQALGAIAGVLTVVGTAFTPLAGAKMTLRDAIGDIVASTYTADDGEFLFYDLADGIYTVQATADGYLATAPMTATITSGSTANINMAMQVDARTYNGTVNGVIRDQNGNAVAGCFVGLYQVIREGDVTKELLVATTKTNSTGNYLFGGVVGGEYLVKAKVSR